MVMEEEEIITLISSDEQEIKLSVKAAKACQFVVDALCLDDPTTKITMSMFAVPRVKGMTLTKIAEFLEVFAFHPYLPVEDDSLRATTFEDLFTYPFYKQYLEQFEEGMGFSDLFYEVAVASKYMGISALFEMICVYVTYKCDQLEIGSDIRNIFKLATDMSRAEKSSLRQEQPWLFTRHDDNEM